LRRLSGKEINVDDCKDPNFTERTVKALYGFLPPDEEGSALHKLRLLRNKRLAHPEHIDLESIPKAKWDDADQLVTLGQNLVTALGAFTSTAYMDDRGDYLLSSDAQRVATSWRRLLKHPGVLGDAKAQG
jgi:hypothetical protein